MVFGYKTCQNILENESIWHKENYRKLNHLLLFNNKLIRFPERNLSCKARDHSKSNSDSIVNCHDVVILSVALLWAHHSCNLFFNNIKMFKCKLSCKKVINYGQL